MELGIFLYKHTRQKPKSVERLTKLFDGKYVKHTKSDMGNAFFSFR